MQRRAPRAYVGRMARLKSVARAAMLPAAAVIALGAGAILHFTAPGPAIARQVWLVGLLFTGLPIIRNTLREIMRRQFAADIVASLAILVALVLQQPFAGLVIVLMQSGGEALEQYAAGRASDAVRLLEEA